MDVHSAPAHDVLVCFGMLFCIMLTGLGLGAQERRPLSSSPPWAARFLSSALLFAPPSCPPL
eukprot:2055190-Rhodomonas_salina.1